MVRMLLPVGCALAFALLPTVANAQSPGPSPTVVRGSVRDASGAPLAGVAISATPGSPVSTPAVTKQNGEYALTVPAGHHELRAWLGGFEEAVQSVTSGSAKDARVDFVLQLAIVREVVDVVAHTGYQTAGGRTATKTPTLLRDVPQSVTVVTEALIKDQMMMSMGDVLRYVPGVMVHQGENNRDQVIIRGNSSSADFFVDGVRDDVQYYRDLYNLERVETLKGPNALIFGRGGAGGVVNRVPKSAGVRPTREIAVQGGMFGNKRASAGINQPLGEKVALRLDGMFEDSGSFRDSVSLERRGVTPTLTYSATDRTKVTVRHEYLHDHRTADRGITSFLGAPADVDSSTFYGDPAASYVTAAVHLSSGTVEHLFGAATVRNHTLVANYDRSYQNFVPGAATADGTRVALTAYNNATNRTNLFNQTDLTFAARTGRVMHTMLAGAEFGRQLTDNLRNTGYFNNTTTSLLVPFSSPTLSAPITFRQSATDADNHLTTTVAAVYVQDQAALSRHLQVVAGVRVDRFTLTYHNNRNGDVLSRPDTLVSPRAGVVYKPAASASIYASYSISYLPSSGDQFSSLTTITEQLKPEQFRNYEIGAKWDAGPGFSVTTALYRLNRFNTRATDPNDATRIVQTGAQRTNGYELGLNGRLSSRWSIAGSYGYQDAFVTSATTAAAAGAKVAQVPHQTLSLWNNYQFTPRVGAGLGVLSRARMFATIDNSIRLPGYTRVDGALFINLSSALRLQANIENLGNVRYVINADSNTNISPGAPRTARIGLTARF